MTLQQLTNFLQDLCHQGNAQKEINKDDLLYIFETFETVVTKTTSEKTEVVKD